MKAFSGKCLLIIVVAAALVVPARAAPEDLQTVTMTVVDSRHDIEVVQFSTGTAVDQLSALQKAQLGCLYSSGINSVNFNACYGNHYESLNQQYVDFFSAYKDRLLASLQGDLDNACPIIHDPCDDLLKFAKDSILTDPDIYEDLLLKADEKKDYKGVDSLLMDDALRNFHTRYVVYQNIRISTAKSLVDTINSIQSYIQASKVPTDFDYETFSPVWTFESLGLPDINSKNGGGSLMTSDADQIATQSVFGVGKLNGIEATEQRVRKLRKQIRGLAQPLAKVKTLKDRNMNPYNFLKQLVPEAKEHKVLQYYIANGIVDSSQFDLTELPSVVMTQIRKNKIKLNSNRRRRMV